MSRALRLVSVAEGVETNAQLEILVAHGCRRAQGYLFGPPAAAAGVAKYVGAVSRS